MSPSIPHVRRTYICDPKIRKEGIEPLKLVSSQCHNHYVFLNQEVLVKHYMTLSKLNYRRNPYISLWRTHFNSDYRTQPPYYRGATSFSWPYTNNCILNQFFSSLYHFTNIDYKINPYKHNRRTRSGNSMNHSTRHYPNPNRSTFPPNPLYNGRN